MDKIKIKKQLALFNFLAIALYVVVALVLFFVETASYNAYRESQPNGTGWDALGLVIAILYGSIFLGVAAVFNLIGGIGLLAAKNKNAIVFTILGIIGKIASVLSLGWILSILFELYPGWPTKIFYILVAAAILAGAVYDSISVKHCK